ncbi:hypothetical protein BGX26_004376 [Mortierella sp. AD094]|nr:hypothetical protein BGX26_004376 [Mortierella sp. AD094]
MSDVFPSLRRLTVTNDGSYAPLPSHSQSAQARLVRCCPNLEALYWRIGGEVEVISASQVTFVQDPGAKEFCSALSKDPWVLPFLDSLDLSWMRVEDEDFATLFKQLNRLKSFTAANTKVGPCWFQALTVHRTNRSTGLCRCLCDTIETLKLEKCQYITSAMVQTFLERCPKLKILCAPTITVTDIAQGKDWVSRDMVELSTHIELDVDSDADGTKFQLIAYSRLAALTKLKNLTLSIQGHGEPKKTLDLRLKAGLSLLETLKNLQSFTFLSEWQQNMEVDEAKWVVEHWPKLKFFRGRPTHDPVTRVLMGRILLARGVILIDYDL